MNRNLTTLLCGLIVALYSIYGANMLHAQVQKDSVRIFFYQGRADLDMKLRSNKLELERLLELCSSIEDTTLYYNNVSIKVWESNYADKYEDLAKLCAVRGDYKTQEKCYNAALECRRRASEIAEADRDLGIVFLISPNLTPEELGFQKKSIKEIARKNNEGFYINLIDSLPIEKGDKKRLLRDADIQEAEIVEPEETEE